MHEVPVKIDELDPPFSVDDALPPYRRKMPTIKDFEPFPQIRRSRESMPTLPDIDPLRHDLPS